MTSQPHHVMTYEGTMSSGYEAYGCPTCGRALLIRWQPWDKIVFLEGDPNAIHSGGKGGLSIASLEATTDEPIPDEFQDWIDRFGD